MSPLAVVVLDLARGDFLEGDRQVVLRGGVDHRRRELVERPLTEVVVVRVDLAGALGGHQHRGVIGIDVLEERVDAGVDHAGEGTSRRALARRRAPRCYADLTESWSSAATIETSCATASSRRSLTTTWPNSPWAASSDSATRRRAATSSSSSVPRPTRRARSASSDGGAMKTWTASGSAARTWRAPWSSISSTTGCPAAVRRSSSERSVP